MKPIKYILISIISLFLFNSCEYEIDYKGDLPEDKLVIASFIQADSVISFSLSKSAKPGTYINSLWYDGPNPLYSDTSSFVYNAKAELFIDGTLRETLNAATTRNQYKFYSIPRANENVEIKLSYKDYKQAIGNATLNLLKPVIGSDSIIFQKAVIDSVQEIYLYRVVVYLEIIDNGGDNYYQIDPDLYYEDYYEARKLSLNEAELLWESIAGVYQEASSSFQTPSNRYGVFSNKQFKGKTYKLKLAIPINNSYHTEYPKETSRLYGSLSLSAIDKKSYDYLFTLNRYHNNSSFMSEPVIIVDGIENAYGFIGAKNSLRVRNINANFNDYEK